MTRTPTWVAICTVPGWPNGSGWPGRVESASPTISSFSSGAEAPWFGRLFDVRVWDERPDGGHFAVWEQPETFAARLRPAVDLLWSR